MSQKRPTLGRGLADLLGQARTAPPGALGTATGTLAGVGVGAGAGTGAGSAAGAPPGERLAQLPVELLQRGRYQPRSDMRADTLTELADSIRKQGIVQPIVVRALPATGNGSGVGAGGETRYEIIAGERRWRAAQQAGLREIPAIIRIVPDEAAIAMALIENIQREDLNPLEEARAFERLISEFELTHQEVAEAVGRSRAAVTNLLRLLELTPEVAELLERRELDMGHARALLGLENRRKQVELAAFVVKKSLSVRDTENLVRRMSESGKADKQWVSGGRDPNVERLETELAEKLGARVQIQHGAKGAGKLTISYGSLDELDGILAHVK